MRNLVIKKNPFSAMRKKECRKKDEMFMEERSIIAHFMLREKLSFFKKEVDWT